MYLMSCDNIAKLGRNMHFFCQFEIEIGKFWGRYKICPKFFPIFSQFIWFIWRSAHVEVVKFADGRIPGQGVLA